MANPDNSNNRKKIFNVIDYGVVQYDPNYASQNVSAMNAAISDAAAIGGGTIVIPNGDIFLNDRVGGDYTSAGLAFEGTGTNARLVFQGGMTNGLYINANGVKVQGLRFLVQASPNINQGSVLYVRNANALPNGIILRDLDFAGTSDARPGNFLAAVNPQESLIANVSIDSNSGEPFGTQSNGIYVLGDRICTDFSVRDCKVLRVNTAFAVRGGDSTNGQQTVEGISFTDNVTFGVQTGLYMTAGYQAPGHSWKGGHINAELYCVNLNSWAQFKISDALLYLNQSNPNAQGFILATNCTQIQAHNNHLIHVAETGPSAGTQCFGVAFAGSTSYSLAAFNDMAGAPPGSACVYNANNSTTNRSFGNSKTGGGAVVVGNITELGGEANI